jgi:hypothetical protein
MTAYFDFGFVAVFILRVAGTRLAQRFSAPYRLNYLTSLQIQVLLARGLTQGNASERTQAEIGGKLWNQYSQEGVFVLDPVTWEHAFQVAHNLLRAPRPRPRTTCTPPWRK